MAVRDTAPLLVALLVLLHTWTVWANVEVNMEDRVEVFRGDKAQITCLFKSGDGIGGITIQWLYVTRLREKQPIYYQDATTKYIESSFPYKDRINVTDNGARGETVLTINDVQIRDEMEFICLVRSLTEGTGEGRTKLKVFEKPERPTIEGMETGISVNEKTPPKIGVCEVKNGFPKPNITWYRNTTPLHDDGDGVSVKSSSTVESSGLFSVRSELSMKVTKEDKNAKFYCEVSYFVPGATRMTETNRINITVYYPSTAVDVWVDSPKGKIKEGDSIVFHCRGNGNTPSLLTLSHNNGDVLGDGNIVVLENVSRQHSGVYKCSSLDTDTWGEINGETTVIVNYLDPAVVKPEDTVVVAQGEAVTATCNALSSLQTNTAWFKNGEEVFTGHTVTLKDVTFDNTGTYTCVVTVPEIEGMETSGTLDVRVAGPPKIMEQDTEITAAFDTMVELSCHVRGFPPPSVTWNSPDGEVFKMASQKETEEGVESVLSVKVISDITALCRASNKYGTDSVTFNIKATIHTTPSTTIITTSNTNTTTTTVSSVKAETVMPPKNLKKEGSGVIIAVVIICILLLAILGSVLYFLYKKGKLCGRSGKQDITKGKSNKENIVVEMKSDNTEEATLLGVNGEKQPASEQ
ncbi:cell surface glycoprotein MUC18-like isoform X2 [Mastacembelus armatus]|uniref:Melanoma cell adhesion molecule b n=2 Tax=Mastacembelus armatus TaxID=205130 RepID=A0A3Q3LK28_9TELE|nr:cell surface glycoprotein MUC18-like isoform X2 [Mastacembelus armatus]